MTAHEAPVAELLPIARLEQMGQRGSAKRGRGEVNDPTTCGLLELLVGALTPEQWRGSRGLGVVYRVAASRRPIGEVLR
ncbi:MAG: hypothetical protein J0I33_00995 [Microbacterium ginsengisoli]|jgi:hypothetical protein|uniref:hypothetical protein n=1 Tax=Microbacterium TaxID=33882 RepID=UPI0006F7B5A3|nr:MULTISPECIES: hypothetical protein [Microbacterium]MBN9197208.1 hypothetical protein [Microbacterium ginsengisoli]ODU52147.1 MAG: hypothetical protein ABT07_01525 [Microbacterium sp. SCN 70-10]KQR91133.1 hypothetical protein ASF93_07180 [Microbacterium sp. Leaf347]KQS01145.1 hypothetical protein ASG00_10010 [Microbacterium sp. Leaf351]KXC07210.1 hypothetical protein MhomT_01295 [Microbacterium hominis]